MDELYKSVSTFREMSTAELCEYLGIRLLWYQKVFLLMLDKKDAFDKKFRPWVYHRRYCRR